MWVKAFLLKCFWKGSAIGLEAYAKTRPKVYIFLLNYLIDNLFTINSQDGTFGINFKKDRRRSCQNFQIFEVSNLKKHALLTIRMCYKIGHSSRLSSIHSTRKVGGPRFLGRVPRNLTSLKIGEGQEPGYPTQEPDPPEKFWKLV